MPLQWKSYVSCISVKEGPKQYGFYKRMGKTFFRNYHRELKNGKGLSWVDILNIKLLEVQKAILKELRQPWWKANEIGMRAYDPIRL